MCLLISRMNFSTCLNRLQAVGVPIQIGLSSVDIPVEPCFLDGTGLPHGMVYRGVIYLRPDCCTLPVLLHEYTHLWVGAFRQTNLMDWVSFMRGCTRLPIYAELVARTGWSDPDLLADECLAVLVGQAFSGSAGADASTCQLVGRVLSDFQSGVVPVGVADERPHCFFLGVQGARRLRWFDPEPYRKLSLARRYHRKNYGPYRIKCLTGWEQGTDFKWRYEDNQFTMADKAVFEAALERPVLLRELYNLPTLYKAYPQLGYYTVECTGTDSLTKGRLINNRIVCERALVLGALEKWNDAQECGWHTLCLTLFHEIQHSIQTIEGFAKGSNIKVTSECQSAPMMRILEWDPAIYNMAITAVCCSDLQGLIKAGISGAKADVERCKQQVRRDSYLFRRCFDSVENVLNRCDEEGYALLVRLLHAALHAPKQPGWDQFKVDCYYRYAGEVEARNAAERTLGLRKGILAESTEEFSRDAQLLALSYSVSNLTRHVWERLCNRLSFC